MLAKDNQPYKSSIASVSISCGLCALIGLVEMLGLAGCNQKSSNTTVKANASEPTSAKTEFRQNLSHSSTDTTTTANPNASLPNTLTTATAISTPQSTQQQPLLAAQSPSDRTDKLENKLSAKDRHTSKSYSQLTPMFAPAPLDKADSNSKSIAPANPTQLQKAYLSIIYTMQSKMKNISEETDKEFVKNMLVHHQTAIALAKLQLKYGKDEALLRLAQDTITAQQTEIDLLQQWLKSAKDTKKSSPDVIKTMQADYEQNAQDMSTAMLKGVSANTADKMFVLTLLPHHKGALAIAETELKYGKDKAMRHMAITIISSQQGEITLIKNWLANQPKR